MKWKSRIPGFIMVMLIAGAAPAYAANESLTEIELRLDKLEQDLAQARNLSELSKELRKDSVSKMFEEFKRQYEQEIKAIRTEQKEFMTAVREEQNNFKYEVKKQVLLIETVWGLLMLFGIGTVISIFYTLRVRTSKLITDEVHQQIGEVTSIQKEYINQIVDDKITENRLKKEKRLLLLTDHDKKKAKRELEKFFESIGFQIKSLYFDEAFDLEQKEMGPAFTDDAYDLVIFNSLLEDKIDPYMEKSEKELFMAYSPEVDHLKVKDRKRMNFANSPFTLYSRTMEMLMYQEVMNR